MGTPTVVGKGVSGVRIRAATLEDAESVARVHVQVWRETYRGGMPDAFSTTQPRMSVL